MELIEFVRSYLPPPPARVLELGCGQGDLSLAIAKEGYEVAAIDPVAPEGEIFRSVSLEQFEDPGPFDAVIASRSLHHIADLAGALDKVEGLLRPAGTLIVNEHAWDRLDDATARWYFGHRTAHPHPPRSPAECRRAWQEDHAELHGYDAIRMELDRRFVSLFFAWNPYLYYELGGDVEQEERLLIEQGEIQATGFRYVGERRRAE